LVLVVVRALILGRKTSPYFRPYVFREDVRRALVTTDAGFPDAVPKPQYGEQPLVNFFAIAAMVIDDMPQTSVVDTEQ